MKFLAILAAVAIIGMIGLVAFHEQGRIGMGSGSSDKIETISHGESVTVEDHLRGGVWTIVEFTADW